MMRSKRLPRTSDRHRVEKTRGCGCLSYAFLLRLLSFLVLIVLTSQVVYFWRGRLRTLNNAAPLEVTELIDAGPKLRGVIGIGGSGSNIVIPASIMAATKKARATVASESGNDAWAGSVPLQGIADTRVVRGEEIKSIVSGDSVVNTMTTARCSANSGGGSDGGAEKIDDVDDFVACRAETDGDSSQLLSLPTDVKMSKWITAGGRFPILVVTCDRVDQLRATLARLLNNVRGVQSKDVIVIVDACAVSDTRQIHALCDEIGIAHHQNPREGAQGNVDGAARIATAYGYALKYALETVFPRAPGVIVVEDDMAFSPDFYEYFHAIAPLLDSDASTWLASAWHDNGFDYLVADMHALRRTRYFPGLGWLLPRKIWVDELSIKWPVTHWDHWMRDPAQHKGRDVVIPEIPRDYHMGVKGTFMDLSTHNDLFGSIALHNDSSFSWNTNLGAAAVEGLLVRNYEARILQVLEAPATRHLSSVAELVALNKGEAVLWYSAPAEIDHASMRPLANFLGIWHEAARGSRIGVHELWWLGSAKLWLINAFTGYETSSPAIITGAAETAPQWILDLKPATITPIDAKAFANNPHPILLRHHHLFGAKFDSPLAHMSGGDDRNGSPDLGSKTAVAAAPRPIAIVPRKRVRGFMSMLRLPNVEPPSLQDIAAHSARLSLGKYARAMKSNISGLSCDEVCATEDRLCSLTLYRALFRHLNSCDALKEVFPCLGCVDSAGPDQPAFIALDAPQDKLPGMCLINGGEFSCKGKWIHAQRLCPCIEKTAAKNII